jgi:hypothetical protein
MMSECANGKIPLPDEALPAEALAGGNFDGNFDGNVRKLTSFKVL